MTETQKTNHRILEDLALSLGLEMTVGLGLSVTLTDTTSFELPEVWKQFSSLELDDKDFMLEETV